MCLFGRNEFWLVLHFEPCGVVIFLDMTHNQYTWHIASFEIWTLHYSDVTMGTMASQITSLTIVYSTVYTGADQKKISKLRVTGLCVRSSPVTGELPAQMASNAENVSIWWRHHEFKQWFGGELLCNEEMMTQFNDAYMRDRAEVGFELWRKSIQLWFIRHPQSILLSVVLGYVQAKIMWFTRLILYFCDGEEEFFSFTSLRESKHQSSLLHALILCVGNPSVTDGFPHKDQ